MIRALAVLALLASSGGCSPAGCDAPAYGFRTPTGPNHYVAGDMASGGGSISILHATTVNGRVGGGSPYNYNATITSTTAGSTLAFVGTFDVPNFNDVTCSSGSFTQSDLVDSAAGGVGILYLRNVGVGITTVTFKSLTYNSLFSGTLYELGGASTTAPLDGHSGVSGVAVGQATGSMTSSGAGGLLVGIGINNWQLTATPLTSTAGTVTQDGSEGTTCAWGSVTGFGAGSYTFTETAIGNAWHSVAGAIFKP